MKHRHEITLALLLLWGLSGCLDSGSSSNPCPAWQVGDTMTYQITETVSGVPGTSAATWTVTEHTSSSVSLTDGVLRVVYAIQDVGYIPQTEEISVTSPLPFTSTDTYTSTTPFCPPPEVGASYEYTTWVPSLAGRGGDFVPATMTVTARIAEILTLPLGNIPVTKLVMTKTGGRADSTVTRYMAENIGVVLEVEVIPSTSTTITKELTTYSYQ